MEPILQKLGIVSAVGLGALENGRAPKAEALHKDGILRRYHLVRREPPLASVILVGECGAEGRGFLCDV